jgi:electron transfer flavoprotein alpha subunit
MAGKILAIAEQRDGSLRRVSQEVVTAARAVADALGGTVDALIIGPAGEGGATLGRFGADRVLTAAGAGLELYSPEAYAAIVEHAAGQEEYFAILFPASAMGRDLAPRVAAKLDLPLAVDATALDIEDGELVITRPLYTGKVFARLTLDASPRLVSVRPNVFLPKENPRDAAVEDLGAAVPTDVRVRVREVVAAQAERPDVAEAAVIVAGGRGLRGPENWQILEDLAAALGPRCALGASRAVVDAGWRPHPEQVGQTGKTVSPQLYFAVGISGAIQHLAGMRTARTIVAVNKDPDAPIFKIADYGIVGDALEIVPKLTEAIRAAGDGR